MSVWSLTYQTNKLFKRYHSDKHFSEFLNTRWRQKSTGIESFTSSGKARKKLTKPEENFYAMYADEMPTVYILEN